MKRRNFLRSAAVLATMPALKSAASIEKTTHTPKEFYEWRIYTLHEGKGRLLDEFYKTTLIPAYNRQNVRVGAFKPLKESAGNKRYFLFIHADLASFLNSKKRIPDEEIFRNGSRNYYSTTAPNPEYAEYETYLCEAFDKIPVLREPEKTHTLFEYRFYHSPNDEANLRKIEMFNKDEIDIFDKTGIYSVCYGNILAGQNMPALIYLTSYTNETTRGEAWAKFGSHPEWQRIKDLPEYAHTATNNTSILLTPLDYSQIG